jgi:ubiquinone/menaquinone biosynthesis C-methylase UbiE
MSSIKYNQKVHDKIAEKYEFRHPEIYNPIEQARLRASLSEALSLIQTNSETKTALDFGCGDGNLTKLLVDLGASVVAADLSSKFLLRVESKFRPADQVKTLLLNGRDLSNIEDNTFDMVATYSVLHHVPDYLKVVSEMIRTVKPGGIIYIDHEVNENYWDRPAELQQFYNEVELPKKLSWESLKYRFRRLFNRRWQEEGDIHVWADDHIEWAEIEQVFLAQKCEIFKKDNYLLYNKVYNEEAYYKYKNQVSDMKMLIARK